MKNRSIILMRTKNLFLRIDREKKISLVVKRGDKSAKEKIILSFLDSASFKSFGLSSAVLAYLSLTNFVRKQYYYVENL